MGTDTALARPAQEASYSAMLTQAFHSHSVHIRRVVSPICGEDEAADVAQEVFARLWTNQLAFDPQRGSLRQYLLTVARGAAIDHVRRRAAQRSREEREAVKHRQDGAHSADELIAQERAARVAEAVGRLPAEQRDLIIATYYGCLTYSSAAALLDIPEGTAKSRIRLGLIRLRFELRDLVPE